MEKDFDYQQMLAGELYIADDILTENRSFEGEKIAFQINHTPIENNEEIIALERKLFGKTGKNIYANPPVYVDYGRHVEIGDNFYANMDCMFLDVNKIIIGNNVMLGPRVGLYTAGHPIDAEIRAEGLEFGLPITIKDNVWIGANATILPGITIGENAIVGAGSVVTKDVPANTIAAGNPTKVLREITDKDKKSWQTKKEKYYQQKTSHLKL